MDISKDKTNNYHSPREMIGQIIALRWEIVDYLGEGNMSYVYKAQDIETSKPIVLKLVKDHLLRDIINHQTFEQQAQKFIALNHENIASYYNVRFSDHQLFLFCDYLEGENLTILLAKNGKLSLEKCIRLFKQICSGLDFAHENKIQHSDLRPSNIFIVNDRLNIDLAKIVDFGLMRLIEQFAQKNRPYNTFTHPALGNALYVSPEQRIKKKSDHRADLYSLGCIMYEAAAGKPPFISQSAMETTYKQISQKPTPLDQLIPAHPFLSRYQKIVDKLLEIEPAKRYQTITSLQKDLALLSANETAWQKADVLQKPEFFGSFIRKWQLPIATLLLLILIAASINIFVLVEPYYHPWVGTSNFDDNKLWIIPNKHKQKPDLLHKKNVLMAQLSVIQKINGEYSSEYIKNLYLLSQINLALGEWYEAKDKLNELQVKAKKLNLVDPIDILANLAFVQLMIGDLNEAERLGEQILSMIRLDTKNIDSQFTVLKILGDIHNQRNDLKQAEAIYERSYKLAQKFRLSKPLEYAYSSAQLADIYRKEQKLNQAENLYKKAIDWGENYIGHNQIFMAKSFYGLALVDYQEHKYTESNKLLQQALPISLMLRGPEDPFTIAIQKFNDYIVFHENIITWLKMNLERFSNFR